MADYKDYIVRYDIQADVTKATEGLQAIANIAKQFEGPMQTLKEAIGTVNSSLLSLKANSQLNFEPKIDVRAFNNQLRGMVIQVKNAAAEMHAALFEALQGNAAAGKAMRQGIGQAIGLKSVSALKSDIAAYEKELDKLMGTRTTNKKGQVRRAADGSIQMAKNAGMMSRVTELEGRKTALQRAIKQRKVELAEAEKLEKEAAAQQAKTDKAAKKAAGTPVVAPKTQPARMTNVTPAVIREWKNAFGDAKNKQLTVNIYGNATGPKGALTTIIQIQNALQELQTKASFNINPTLNMEGFAAAEAQLMKLAELSKAVTAPFAGTSKSAGGAGKGVISTLTKEEQARLTQAQQTAKMWNEKIAGVQNRLEANKAKYALTPTSTLKGQITRDENKLASYRGFLSEQEKTVNQLQAKAGQAIPAAGKAAKPLTVDILGNLTGLKSNGKELVIPVVGELTKIQNKVKEAIPVNVKIMADQVAESLRSIPRPSILVDVRLNTEGIAQQIQAISQSKPVAKTKQVKQPSVVPTTSAWTSNDETLLASQMAEKERLKKLRDNARRRLTTAQARHEESGGSDRTFNRLLQAKKDFGASQQKYSEAQEKVNTLMQRKTQSMPPVAPTSVPTTTAPISSKAVKAQPLAIDVMANVTGVKAATEMMIPVVGEMTKVINKSSAEIIAPVIGELSKVVNKISAEVFVPVIGELTKVVSKISTEIITPVVGEITKVVSKGTAEAVVPVVGEIARTVIKGTGEQVAPVIGELSKVVNKIGIETLVPVVGELTKVVSKISTETLVPVIGELSKVVSKVTTEVLVPVVGQLNKVLNEVASEITIPVIGKLTKVLTEVSEVTIPIIGKLNTAGISEQIKSLQRPTIPVNIKLMWERGAIGRQEQLKSLTKKLPPVVLTLDTTTAVEKLNEFINLVRSKSPQNIALTATGTATKTGAATGAATSTVAGATSKQKTTSTGSTKNNKPKEPLTAQERYDKMKSNATVRNALTTKQTVSKWQEQQMKERNWHAQQQAKYDRLFGAVKSDEGWFNRAQSQRNSELAQMRADAQAAFGKGLTPYEKQLQAQQRAVTASSIARHQRQLEGKRAQVWNAMAPFAQTKEQLGVMVKHRKFFRQAVTATGIIPTATTAAPQMLQYLQGVSTQMQRASVAVPWQLQSQINKLQAQINKTNGVQQTQAAAKPTQTTTRPARVPAPVPFYDKARKWAYPFTGNTSFGARTPMAVDMAKGMGVMFAIGGAMSAVGNSFSQAMEYQNTMRTTKAILQNGTKTYTDTGFRGMEEIVRNVGVKTKFSAPEVASAARFLAMAGYDIPAINNAIRPIADLALIGDTDLGETADKMTNIMTTFGIPAEKMREAANIMTTTATRSNTDLMMLAESAKYGGGVANMYGRGDKNLFADTMALFGVMGNAGIQASSAGTALRMMYQNIFKPNKNQKAVLDMLDKNYGIKTLKADGGFRAMSDIIVDIAQKVPQDKLASIVGNLFRITAQPGASASIMAASNQAIAKAAEEDGTNADEVAAGGRAIEKFLEKNGLSKLVELMMANRESVNTNVSENIAFEKQNTITGLWNQVTSTFTEGIVKAFEGKEGYFAETLGKVRDYLAKPETVQMIQNLMDMLIGIGECMADFVKFWAWLYNLAPKLIQFWVKTQLFFTQLGTCFTPIVSLIGVLSRLSGSLITLAGASTTATASISTQTAVNRSLAGGAAANAVTAVSSITAPMAMGRGLGASPVKNTLRNQALLHSQRAVIYKNQAAKWENAILGAMAIHGFTGQDGKDVYFRNGVKGQDHRIATAINNKRRYIAASAESTRLAEAARERHTQVQARANRIYGTWARSKRAFNASAMINAASWAAMSTSIKQTFSGLMVGMAKAVGLLFNPITLAIGALTGFGVYLHQLNNKIKGETDGQKETRKKAEDAAKLSEKAQEQRFKSAQDLINTYLPAPVRVTGSGSTVEQKGKNQQQRYDRNSAYAEVFTDLLKNPSSQAIEETASRWKNRINKSSSNRLALGDLYDKYAGNALTMWKHYDNTYIGPGGSSDIDLFGKIDNNNLIHTAELQERMAQAALMLEGANNKRVIDARNKIIQLRQQFLDKKIAESDYIQQAKAIIQQVVNPTAEGLLSADNLTPAKLKNDTNWSRYQLYQQGGWNVLNAEMLGERGTITGYYNAINTLNSGVKAYTDQWWEAISYITGNYRVNYDILVNGQSHTVSMLLSTLPDGRLDFSGILEQIRQKVAGFKLNLQTFSDMIATAYRIMASSGANVDTSFAGFIKFTKEQNQHQHITAATAGKYYDEKVANNPQWDGVSRERYINWVTNPDSETINVNGKQVNNARERVTMRQSIATTAGINQKRQYDEARKKFENIGGGKITTTNNTNNAGNGGNSGNGGNGGSGSGGNNGTNQKDYQSRYDRTSARPTQVIINVDKLANFDRTMIASSAEERDLISAMESRITEAVYRVFAEAANSANNIMDRV